ncbi:5'-nucleotidase C-terminal domain-containing protein [Halanaerobium praevalens]|uniref:5'-Nucleotidase domain-containing protein n=1 Tax=Halanaerobium praevalens (strain ATCC 33744 / DSM 2228 / GSL) TaxID=572479 RepID=E3DN54_HALPG|nr:5'-nucleotidase C-terminal domain-containing protein [Halanaerobium praevalens]ADO76460.1 5'-Nucleotidase domain-containing protein [Halanaerobium praevalens DSM 2228]
MFKKRKILLFTVILTLSFMMLMGGVISARDLTVIATSDIHGAIYPWSYKIGEADDIGLAKIAAMVKEARAENPNLLLVDAGDTIQGNTMTSFFKDRRDVVHPMMKVMNEMGYDAMVLGNHEFNFGLEKQQEILADAKFPILSANTIVKKTGKPFAHPYTIKEVAGIKIGILGLTTTNIPIWDGDKVASLEFRDMDQVAADYIPELKEKADIIIALAHAGLDGRYDKSGGDKARKIAENNPEIDLLITGHDHDSVNQVINGVLVMAAEDAGEQASKIKMSLSQKNGKWVVDSKSGTHLAAEDYEADPEILAVAKPYHQAVVEYVNTPIGYATGDFTPEPKVEGIPAAQVQDTALVDLINRVQLKNAEADISSAALFIADSTIDKGPVSIKDAARIYKYSNTLYGVKISGKELKKYLESTVAYYNTYQPGDITISFNPEIRGYAYDMFQGIDYKIDISQPVGNRIKDLKYEGKAIKDDQTFKLALNNYRYSGLHSSGIISNEPYYKSEAGIREMIIEYIDQKEKIDPVVDHNWEIVGANLDHAHQAEALSLINNGVLKIPAVNRSWNAESINLEARARKMDLTKAIVRMFNYDLPAKIENPSFSGLEAGDLAYAEAALKAGFVKANNGDFEANKVLSRQEAAIMLVEGMRIADQADTSILNQFKDENKIVNDPDQRAKLALAVEMGLLVGRENKMLAPDKTMKFGEMAAMLHRVQNNYQQLDVLSTNDFHGKVEAGYEAGAAKLMGAIKHYRSANPKATILVDGGDSYQGTPISSLNNAKPVIEFMNEARYSAQAVGNHEFDWGIDELKRINSKTYFPMLAANIVDKDTGELVDWVKPTQIIPAAGYKVGLIGIATPDTESTTMPSNIAELDFTDPAIAIKKYTKELRKKGVDMVFVVSHLPGTTNYDTGQVSGELVETAKQVEVTGIIGGHSHHTVTAIVNGNPIVEAYKHGRELGNLRYFINKKTKKIYSAMPMSHPVRKSVIKIKEDPEIKAMVKKYQKELEPIMSEVLIESDSKLVSNYDTISKVGALTTDSMAAEVKADIAFQNPGGLRIDLPQGKINVGHIYELLPFGNTIVSGEMTGKQIVSVLEQSLTFNKGMLQHSGLKVEYDPELPKYERVVSVKLADGSPLKMNQKYRVATNNFLAEGGDGFKTFNEIEFKESYIKVRDALIKHLRQLEEIKVKPENRVIEVDQSAGLRIRYAA